MNATYEECYDAGTVLGENFEIGSNQCYNITLEEKFALKDNQCYSATPSRAATSRCDTPKDSKSSRVIPAIFVLLVALLLGMVAACIAFAVEISKLKSQTAPFETSSSFQDAALDNRLQQLIAGLGERGQYASFPADSCAALPPSSPSGYYWVRTANGSAVRVYCDMTRLCGGVTGGWMRVAYLDMTNSSHQCPSALRQRNDRNISTCATNPDVSCSAVPFTSNGLSYSRVCGMIRGYQVGTTDSFALLTIGSLGNNINFAYVDGISLTYGFPRHHIWTFAAANSESDNPISNCRCINSNQAPSATQPPSFVGDNYFCATGAETRSTDSTFYSNDPLWDGAGCGPLNTCCSFNDPPWFYRKLPQPTTDSIEMRVCRDNDVQDENIALELIEIYIQ